MPDSDSAITARASMLIRRPAAEVFRAITLPDILVKFWLARASGPLEATPSFCAR